MFLKHFLKILLLVNSVESWNSRYSGYAPIDVEKNRRFQMKTRDIQPGRDFACKKGPRISNSKKFLDQQLLKNSKTLLDHMNEHEECKLQNKLSGKCF